VTGTHSKPPPCKGSGERVLPAEVKISLSGRSATCANCEKTLWLNRALSNRGEGAYDYFYPQHIGEQE
jgi:hypothetical protein